MNRILELYKIFRTDGDLFNYRIWMAYNRRKINFIRFFFLSFTAISKKFITFHIRPAKAKNVGTWSDKILSLPKIAIVIQGPLVTDKNFTLETVRLYKKHFPDTVIIVSASQGSDPDCLEAIRKENAEVVLNKNPENRGIGNINLQITSTAAGLRRARELGAEYAYKTRSDQRMYAVNLNEFLVNLINYFPVAPGFKQNKRIIASSFLTLKYFPYLITDVLQFGQIGDMLAYWDIPFDSRKALDKPIKSVRDLAQAKICEAYLCSEFLKKTGRELKWTIADSWQAYAEQFIIVDSQTLDLLTCKYDFYNELGVNSYDGIRNNRLLTFAEWFNLYSNLKNKRAIDEKIMDLPRTDNIIPEKYGN